MYGLPRLTVHVADAPEEVDWTLPRPKKVEVEALDGFTLEPVKRFTVRAENPFRGMNPSWGPQSRDAEDSNFSGWVPAVEKYLTVSSPGYQEVRVDLDPSKPSESFSVRLFPGQVGNLVLQGQVKGLAGQTITLNFERLANPEDPAHPFFVGDHEVRVQVEDPSGVPFPLPGGEGYFLSLEAHYSKGFLWSFSPSRVPIQGTNDLVFVVKGREYQGDPSWFK